jgi:uncharacterized membrane protein
MITLILILAAIFLLTLGGAVIIWLFFYTRRSPQGEESTNEAEKPERLPFRWSYIMLPSAIFFLAVILAAFFYPQLPTEVAYHFKPDGSADKWLSREAILIWMLTPQLGLALLAGTIVWGMTRLSSLFQQAEGNLKLEKIISLMGNIIGLPQLIICFAMLNIFSYNSYGTQIMPIWIFALIIMGLGLILLGIFFIQAIRQILRPSNRAT